MDPSRLLKARDLFEDLVRAGAKEAEFQRLFRSYPEIFLAGLPLRVAPRDIKPLARPGRSEPDFVIFPQDDSPTGTYGIIEIERPTTKILVERRKGTLQLSSDAQTALAQCRSYGHRFEPLVQAQRSVVLGSDVFMFIIIGMSAELAERVSQGIYANQLAELLPPSCHLIPYDTLLRRFTNALPPQVVMLVPDFYRPSEAETAPRALSEHTTQRTRVRATAEHCYAVVTDFAHYPDWAPDIMAVTIEEKDAHARPSRVTFQAAAFGRSTAMTLEYDYSRAPRRLSWVQSRGDITTRYDGSYQFEDLDDGEIDVIYNLEVDFRIPIPGFVKRRAESRIIAHTLNELKARAER